MRIPKWLVIGTVVALGCGREDPLPEISAEEIAAHVRVLASDAYLGRGPGQRGGDLAVGYVQARFEEYGLEVLGGSYLQAVPVVGTSPDPAGVTLTLSGSLGSTTPTYLDDFVLSPGDPEATSVSGTGELVFVGYGVDAPQLGWNDFEGVDVAGKYLLILVNDPPAPPDEPELFGGVAMTYYGRWTYKYEEAARRGALGALIVHETEPAGYPWGVVRSGFSGEQFALPLEPGQVRPPGMIGWVSVDAARAALATAGLEYDSLKAQASRRGFRAVTTGVAVTASVSAETRRLETQNVAGMVRGSERPDEYILLTSHYDHLGVGAAVDGDSIYNGAYDNASGISLVLALARALAQMEPAPGRSVVVVATGAEEQGLLGAERYVRAPLVPLAQTVAEVNFDQANVWGRTTDVTVFGEERTELGVYVRERSARLGLTLVPDPSPGVGTYFRSDHFPFARAGVPSLYIVHGWDFVGRPAGWGDSIRAAYLANDYHRPSDHAGAGWVYSGAVQEGELALGVILDLASTDAWPNWLEGQEFKAARDAMRPGG